LANPQTENGYTKIANELLEAFCFVRLGGDENKVFWMIIRKTYGFNKKEDEISLSQFCLGTGLRKQNVCRALSNLIKKNMIIKSDKSDSVNYRIQKDYTLWKPLSNLITLSNPIMGVIKSDKESVIKSETHKRNKNTKETLTKEKEPSATKKIPFPEWIPKDIFFEFKKMRTKIKKPMTEFAESKLINKLEKLKDDGYDPGEVLEQSIINSWAGVFPLHNEKNKPKDFKGTAWE
jgi:phage replication O-like protein O